MTARSEVGGGGPVGAARSEVGGGGPVGAARSEVGGGGPVGAARSEVGGGGPVGAARSEVGGGGAVGAARGAPADGGGPEAPWRLERLLRPRSVAVVGASERPGSYGGEALLNLARLGFPGAVYAVNPRRARVHGVPAFPSLDDLPAAPDAVVVAIPAAAAAAVVERAGALGCGGAVVFAAGFAEGGGAGLEADLVVAARRHRLPVCGPNGNGIVSLPDRVGLWGDTLEPREPGPVALISQSGNVAVNALASRRGLRLHTVISCGNQAVLDASDFLTALAERDGVRSVALYLEADGDGERWCAALERCARAGIGVAVLKAGASPAGAAAAQAHTGALSGDHRIARALFEEAGAAWAEDPHELLELAKTLAVRRFSRVAAAPVGDGAGIEGERGDGRRGGDGQNAPVGDATGIERGDGRRGDAPASGVAVMTCSGGDSAIAADFAARLGLALPALAPDTLARLRELLPAAATAANPLDYTSLLWDEPDALRELVLALAGDPAIGQVLVLYDEAGADDASGSWAAVLDAVRAVGEVSPVPVAVASTLPELLDDAVAARLLGAGLAAVAGLRTGLRCVAALAAYPADPVRIAEMGGAAARARPSREGARNAGAVARAGDAALAGSPDAREVGAWRDTARGSPDAREVGAWLDEAAAKALLRAAGIAVVPGRLAASADDAVAAWRELGGPVAIKRTGARHKSEGGGVVLGLDSEADVRGAHARLMGVRQSRPPGEGEIDAPPVLVERMAPPGVEIVLAVRRDGLVPVLVAGLGGIWTELLDDVAVVPLPATPARIERALDGLRGAPLLRGGRGQPALDVAAAASLAAALAGLAVDFIELNPVVVHERGAVAVDALAHRQERST